MIIFFALLISVNAYLYQEGVDETLVPEFGVITGTDRNVIQVGSCTGLNGQFIPIYLHLSL